MSIASAQPTPAPAPSASKYKNAAEWLHALGDIPPERIVMDPPPGTATEKDVFRYVDGDDKRLVELVDGTLVEKTVGFLEALIALKLGRVLGDFVAARKLGIVAGADATMRMKGRSVRLPDLVFVSINDLPGGKVPQESIPTLPPTLAVEVISKGNTKAEMRRKKEEYFESGTKLVWFIYPKMRTIAVFDGPSEEPVRVFSETDTLDGGSVVPGFSISVADVFDVQA